jgi:hypothetical protein
MKSAETFTHSDFSTSLGSECSSEAQLFNITSADLQLLEGPQKKRVLFDVSKSSSADDSEDDQIDITDAETTLRNIFKYSVDSKLGISNEVPNYANEVTTVHCPRIVSPTAKKEMNLPVEPLTVSKQSIKTPTRKVTFQETSSLKQLMPSTAFIPLGHKILNQADSHDSMGIEETSESSYEIKAYAPKDQTMDLDDLITSSGSASTMDSESVLSHANKSTVAIQMLPMDVSTQGNNEIYKVSKNIPDIDHSPYESTIPSIANTYSHFKPITIEEEKVFEQPVAALESETSKTVDGLKRRLSLKWSKSNTIIRDLESQVEHLQTIIESQKKSLNQYEDLTNHLHNESRRYKESYDLGREESAAVFTKYKECQKELNEASAELQSLHLMMELEAYTSGHQLDRINLFLMDHANIDQFRKCFQAMQRKNMYLQHTFRFLTKNIDNIYRYTIAPALYLTTLEPESANESLSFESTNTIQAFLNCNYDLFKDAYDMSLVDEIESEEAYCEQQEMLLQRLEKYFEKLNILIAGKMENVVCEKLSV